MELKSISISNFRSIHELEFQIEKVDNSRTYVIIGANEAGKSSLLTALSLFNDDGKVVYPRDYSNDQYPIVVSLEYRLTPNDKSMLKKKYLEEGYTAKHIPQFVSNTISVAVIIDPALEASKQVQFDFELKVQHIKIDKKKDETEEEEHQVEVDLEKLFLEKFDKYFLQQMHDIVLWKSEPRFLISDNIDLNSFSANPNETSIPLANCFSLAGIEQTAIAGEIKGLNDNPSQAEDLQDLLSDKVTAHINKLWPSHPILIKFRIDNNQLTFIVKDKQKKYQSTTTEQRSDGFRQFVSFLLTVSATNSTDEFANTILLLDEPETHLHPQAQDYLKRELIQISKNDRNNIVMFATHSTFMIEKKNIDRCFRLRKNKHAQTELQKIGKGAMSYAEVNHDVFEIYSNDFHNELFGFIELEAKEKLAKLPKIKKWYNEKTKVTQDVSLPLYIRHSIHHPENDSNPEVTEKELSESIKLLVEVRQKIPKLTKPLK